MSDINLRKKLNAKRPDFKQVGSYKRKRVDGKWRKPRGMHSKMRHQVWGKPAIVKTGYRGPNAARGLDPSGLTPVLVHNQNELAGINPKTQGALLASVGARKKAALLATCKERNITVLNAKNIDDALNKINTKLRERKQAKEERAKKEEKTKKSEKKETKPKEEKPEEQPEDETKTEEQKQAEKIITKRE